ncbi:MAG: hypothetical protein QJR12_12855 [Mycobacterium sp.]|uniref:type I-G CRISPR-associated protein, Cas3-extension family n=1 Tax=Mycobacterium sp. TaxID=1785 RepID=UPI0026231DAF|nr:hypothetical protein [Mycobacterium sp.]MDI3315116.1 hypothetical protein [Mycobacterium sp.]
MSERTLVLNLDGLDGTNPMGFLAGLGVLAILDHLNYPARLWWADTLVPRARIQGTPSIDALVEEVGRDREKFGVSALLDFPPGDPATDIKFGRPEQVRDFLQHCRKSEPSSSLSAALVCEGVVDNQGHAKPTDLHFTAGQQQFLSMVRELQQDAADDHLRNALYGPWKYESTLPSFKWDSTDDRDHAFAASNPAKEKKRTAPGAEWLAFRGLTLFPVHPKSGRVQTPGGGGIWKSGWLTWPLWRVPISTAGVRTLIQAVPRDEDVPDRFLVAAEAWGVHRLMRSRITRSGEGGYGTFRPAQLVWSAASSFEPRQPL